MTDDVQKALKVLLASPASWQSFRSGRVRVRPSTNTRSQRKRAKHHGGRTVTVHQRSRSDDAL